MWSNELRLPVPPLETVAPTAVNFWTTTVFLSMSAIIFLYGLKHWKDTKRPIILLMMIGGALTVLVEPFLDVVGAAWHPEVNQPTAFELMGRSIPWWVVSIYIFYFGALGSLNFLSFEKGVTTKQIWAWALIPLGLDVLMEEIMMQFDLYYYYGDQPLIVFTKFPLWWAPCNGIGEFLAISLIVLMAPHLRGWKLALVPLSMPIADSVGYAAVAMPSWVVINTQNVPYWVNQLGGILTFVLFGFVVHGVALVLAKDSPLRVGRTTLGNSATSFPLGAQQTR